MRKLRYKKIILIGGGLLLLLVIFYASLFLNWGRGASQTYGVSFDPVYARYLGVDAGKAYFEGLIRDWGFRYIRLPAHWESVEAKRGQYNFSDLDWYVNRAADAGAKVVLAIGQKTPRWPECHEPKWAKNLPSVENRAALLKYITATVEHYRARSGIEFWQVENEPFLDFGECHAFSASDLKEEIALVKRLDQTHPTITTDSGELSLWWKTAKAADYFGTTMYRTVWDKMFGYFTYRFLPPGWYTVRALLLGRSLSAAFVMELQGEPWSPGKPITSVPLAEQYRSMNRQRLQENIEYAKRSGFPRAYLWGAEWWYWLQQNGYKEIPDFVKTLPKGN
ncbi:MAG: beta-galactosidase [Candidatus Magasanikbacteria bacterium]|nr:beta-galactosidase [Candidatus Magasanikbacteria bacterium]